MQIYNLSHAFGLFSFVDPLIVRIANFSAGGFQAEYGGRLSSVFDIQTIDEDKNRFRARGTLDLLSSDVLLTGPLFPGGNSSFIAFYRRPLFQNALQKFYSLGLLFDYYDGFAKATLDFSGTGHISAEFLTSSDQVLQSSPLQPDFRWSNNSGAVSGGYIFADQFDMKFSVSSSTYRAEPRLTLSYRLSDLVTLYTNCGIYHQRLMDMNDENLVFTPFDVIAPVPENSTDEEASQYILGCQLEPNNLVSAKIEVYYKDLNHLVAVNLEKVFEWENDYVFGAGKAYGLDASFRYDAGESLYLQAGF